MNQEAPIIVGLDIGTTKIAAIAGRKNEYGKLEILGFGKAPSFGVQHGMVLNIDQTIKAIRQALENCYASNPNLEINEVYVGIAGHHIKSLQTRGDIVRSDTDAEISQKDIDQLINDQYKTVIPASDQIIDVIPQQYIVDSLQNITYPIGMSGVKVGANFHIITGDKNAIRNINRSVEKSGLKIHDLVLQPLASAAAVMCDLDFEAGVAIVDIGGGTTDLAVFYEGILKHTAVIPYGGENITNDIKNGLGVLKTQAEQMKVQFGYALADEAKNNAYHHSGPARTKSQGDLRKEPGAYHPGAYERDPRFRGVPPETDRYGQQDAERWYYPYRWRISAETPDTADRVHYRCKRTYRLSERTPRQRTYRRTDQTHVRYLCWFDPERL